MSSKQCKFYLTFYIEKCNNSCSDSQIFFKNTGGSVGVGKGGIQTPPEIEKFFKIQF